MLRCPRLTTSQLIVCFNIKTGCLLFTFFSILPLRFFAEKKSFICRRGTPQ